MLKSALSLFALVIVLSSLAQNETGMANDLKNSIKNEDIYKSSVDLTKIQSELIQKRLNLTLKYNQIREDYLSSIAYGLKVVKSLEKTKRRALDSLSILKSPFELEYEKSKQLYLNYDTLSRAVEKFNTFLEENKVLNDLIGFKNFCSTQYYTDLVDCYLSQGGAIAYFVTEPGQIKKLSKILEENSQNERLIFLYEDTKSKKNSFYVINVDTLNLTNFKITSFYYTKDGKELTNFKSYEQKEDLYRFIKNYDDVNQVVYKSHGVPHLKSLDKKNVLKITAKNEVITCKSLLDSYVAEEKRISEYFDEQIQNKRNNLMLFDLENLKKRRISDSLEIAEEITYYEKEFPEFLKCFEALKTLSNIDSSDVQEAFLRGIYEDLDSDFLNLSKDNRLALEKEFDKTVVFECLLSRLNEISSSPFYKKPIPGYGKLITDGFTVWLKGFDIVNKTLKSRGADEVDFPNGSLDLEVWIDAKGTIKYFRNKNFDIRFDQFPDEEGEFLGYITSEKIKVYHKLSYGYLKIGEFIISEGNNNTKDVIVESFNIAKSSFEQGDYYTVREVACECGLGICEDRGAKIDARFGSIYKFYWYNYPIEIVDEFDVIYHRAGYLSKNGFSSSKTKKSFCFVNYNGDKYEIKLLGEQEGKVVYNLYKRDVLTKTVTGKWEERYISNGGATKLVIEMDGANSGLNMEFFVRKYSNGAWQDLQEMGAQDRIWDICL